MFHVGLLCDYSWLRIRQLQPTSANSCIFYWTISTLNKINVIFFCQFRWSCSLRHRSVVAWTLGFWVRILLKAWMCDPRVCCVSSGLCYELITHSKESYRVCLSNCVWCNNLSNGADSRPIWAVRHRKKKTIFHSQQQLSTTNNNG
jgi:hypothetical protein